MRGLFALLTEECLNNAVAANSNLQETRAVAAVIIPPVAVIAFFGNVKDAVAADRSCGDETCEGGSGGGRFFLRDENGVSGAAQAVGCRNSVTENSVVIIAVSVIIAIGQENV